MAVMTVTPASVSPLTGAVTRDFNAGYAGSVGDIVIIAADGDIEEAQATVAGTANGKGIVIACSNGGLTFAAGEKCTVVVFGPVAGFSGLTPDDVAYVSNTAGALDDAAGTVAHIMGYVESAEVVFLNPAVA